jgi:hypothetical protein
VSSKIHAFLTNRRDRGKIFGTYSPIHQVSLLSFTVTQEKIFEKKSSDRDAGADVALLGPEELIIVVFEPEPADTIILFSMIPRK